MSVHKSMFVAGVSGDAGEKALKLWHLRNATSFNGKFIAVYLSILVKGIPPFILSQNSIPYYTGDFMKKVPTATCALRDR